MIILEASPLSIHNYIQDIELCFSLHLTGYCNICSKMHPYHCSEKQAENLNGYAITWVSLSGWSKKTSNKLKLCSNLFFYFTAVHKRFPSTPEEPLRLWLLNCGIVN